MNRYRLAAFVVSASILFLTAAPVAAQTGPPAGKNYAVVLIVRDPEFGLEVSFDCLRFRGSEICTEDGDCGQLEITSSEGQQNAWRAELMIQTDLGETVEVVLDGRTEKVGPKSSIGGTARLRSPSLKVNAGFAGAQVKNRACTAFSDGS